MAQFGDMSIDNLKKSLIEKLDRLHLSDSRHSWRYEGKAERLFQELQIFQLAFEMQKRELLEARQSLREARARYADLYDSIPIGHATIDERGYIQEINAACASMIGIARSQMDGMPLSLFVAKEDLKALRAHIERCALDGRAATELKLNSKGAAPVPVELSSVRTASGGNTLFKTVITDLRRIKKAEEENERLIQEAGEGRLLEKGIREYKERLEAVLDSSDEMIFFKNDELRYVFANRAFQERFGLRREEVIGSADADFMKEEMASALAKSDGDVIRSGGIYEAEERIEEGDFHIYKKRLLGPVSGIVGSIRDVTGRRRREEETLKARELESLGMLAAGIAHDFNNLLTGVLGNASLAKMHVEGSSRVSKILSDIERVSLRAKDITQQLLTFATGGAPVKQTAPIPNILRDAAFAVRGHRVTFDFSIPAWLWPVEADEGQIRQVINNLVINADQAMHDGGTITISARNIEVGERGGLPLKPGRYVKITVEDMGPGIPREDLHKIFDPYFTTKQKGSGLGLAIAYSIIKRHDGLIDVESRLGVGTAFHIYLPASGERPVEGRGPY